jgi:hypothetical protein
VMHRRVSSTARAWAQERSLAHGGPRGLASVAIS